MDDVNQLLNNIGSEAVAKTGETHVSAMDFSWFLKLPVIIILFVNVFAAVLLFLRVRILSDTIATSGNKRVKKLLLTYLVATVIGTLLSILFLILA